MRNMAANWQNVKHSDGFIRTERSGESDGAYMAVVGRGWPDRGRVEVDVHLTAQQTILTALALVEMLDAEGRAEFARALSMRMVATS